MSTLKVDAIRHNSATSDAITTHSDGTASAKIIDIGGQQLSNRNLLINGDMQISQRNGTTSTAYTNAQYSLDRWQIVNDNASSKFTTQQVTDAPVGFYNSLKMTSSSAYTPVSGEVFGVGQKIEGYNTNWLGFGSSNAKSITISFFVKSSLTGTFGGSVLNSDMLRGYPWTYTISSANTWERKTVTVTGATDGSWNVTNGTGIRVHWSMGAHANRSGTAGQWSSTQYTFHPTGATDVVATNGATLQITGCQVEVGDTATTFEHRSFGEEEDRCMRYYEEGDFSFRASGSIIRYCQAFNTRKRANPTMKVYYDSSKATDGTINSGNSNNSGWSRNPTGRNAFNIEKNTGSNGNGVDFAGHYTAESEL